MEFVNTFKQFWKARNIPENYDIYSVLESVWIWKLYGVIINVPKGPIGERRYVISKFFIVYNFLLLCLFVGAFVERFWDKILQEYMQQAHITLDGSFNIYMRQFLNFSTMIELFFWKLTINKQFIEICDLLDTQDKILKDKLQYEINYKSHTKKIGIFAGCYIFAHILMSFQQLSYGFSFSLFMDYLSWWFPIIIQKSNLCLFMSLVLMLGARFNALNKKLEIIIKSSALRYSQSTFVSDSNHIEMFRIIASMHGMLCKIGERMNHVFMLALVQCVLEAFVYITLVLYNLIVEAQKTHFNFPLFLTYFLLLISCITAICMIVMICNWTSKKASNAENLIYKIRVQEADNTLSQLIQEFSMQMLHQKLSFSIGGLFSLDSALLQSMTGVITTYLVILIQFGQMESTLFEKDK